MKQIIVATAVMLVIAVSSCSSGSEAKNNDSTETLKSKNMNNLISIVEIPVTDFPRAVGFYRSLLGISIETMEMDGVQLGVFPNGEGTVNVVLAKGNDYKPTADGAVLYLNAGNDLQPLLDKVEQYGGQVIVPKTEISPEMGCFALFIDTEGNKLGLHSAQ